LRLIPFLMLLYFVAFLDRINVGFAALTMNKDVGLTAQMFGLGSGIFFLGYFVFEVPSTVILHKVGARFWIGRVMITWGLVSIAMAFTRGPISFYVLRFLLGLAEAGFFPGIILYLSYWFPAQSPLGGDRDVHGGRSGCGTRRVANLGRTDADEWPAGSARLAVALPRRRCPRTCCWAWLRFASSPTVPPMPRG
jgi:MFS family permease